MRREKRLVGVAFFEQHAMQRQRDDDVSARAHGQIEIGVARDGRHPRIDDDDPGAVLLRGFQERHRVDAGDAGVDAPEDDQPRGRVVLIRDRRHLAVERLVGGAGRRRAECPQQARGAESSEENRVGGVLCQQPVRSAVAVGQDGLGAERRLDARRSPTRSPRALRPTTRARTGRCPWALCGPSGISADPRRTGARETPDLRADVAARRVVGVAAIHLDDASVAHADRQAAGVRTIERTRRRHLNISAEIRPLGHASDSKPKISSQRSAP